MKLRNMTSIYILKGDRVLLLYRRGGRVVTDVWVGSAGGHFEPGELNDPQACVLRELNEETGLTMNALEDLRLRYVTVRMVKGEIRQNYYYFAELKEGACETLSSCEGELQWFPLSEISDLKMPYTAQYMMDHYLETGRFDEKLYCGAAGEKGMVFTELEAFI